MPLREGIPVGSLFGIPVRIHILLPLFLIAQALFSLGVHFGERHLGTWIGYSILMSGPVLFFTVLVHELGHCLACRHVGGTAHSILLWPLGGLAFVGHEAGPARDMWVAFAGPLTHVPMFIIWLIGLVIANHGDVQYVNYTDIRPDLNFGAAVCLGGMWVNVVLAAFNLLLPAYPLDGGRIFCDFLLVIGLAPTNAAYITIAVAVAIAVAVIVWGWVDTVLSLVLVGAFMLYSTYNLFQYVRGGMIAEHPMFKFSCQQGAGYQGQPKNNDAIQV